MYRYIIYIYIYFNNYNVQRFYIKKHDALCIYFYFPGTYYIYFVFKLVFNRILFILRKYCQVSTKRCSNKILKNKHEQNDFN
jgi:hypothetical protein